MRINGANGNAAAISDAGFKQAASQRIAAAKRDTRLDVFRALALLTIFINHIPGTVYEYITHKHFGFSDSAEAFVLVSGMAVGLAYGHKFHLGNRLALMLKMWKRSFTLYYTHLTLTLFTLALFCGAGLYAHHAELLGQINIGAVMQQPAQALIGIVTLGHQLGYNNILPLYMALLLFAPLMLWLAQKSMAALLVLSGALYLFAGFYGIAPHNYPTAGVWFLNPLSWQFLFVIGLCATLRSKQGGRLPQSPLLLAAAVGYLLLALIWVRWNWWNIDTTFGVLPYDLAGFNKTFLSLPRLAHILALSYVIAAVPALSRLARVGAQHPLAVLGKYSLPVFVCGTALAMVGQVLKQLNPTGGFAYDSLLIATGIIVQFAYAYYLEWLGGLKKKTVAAPAPPAEAAAEPSAPIIAGQKAVVPALNS